MLRTAIESISKEEDNADLNYVVEAGDTLSGISLKCSVSVHLLKKYNHLFGKNDLFVGQVLRLQPKPEVTEKPFLPLSRKTSSFKMKSSMEKSIPSLQRIASVRSAAAVSGTGSFRDSHLLGIIEHRSTTAGSHIDPLMISQVEHNSSPIPLPSNLSSNVLFRYRANSNPDVATHIDIEDELNIIPRRSSAYNRDRAPSDLSDFAEFEYDPYAYAETPVGTPQYTVLPLSVPHVLPQHTADDKLHTTETLTGSPCAIPPLGLSLSHSVYSITHPQLSRASSYLRQPIDTHGYNSSILSNSDIQYLVRSLPLGIQNDGWDMLYCVSMHGSDISTFYQRVAGYKYSLVVVKTMDGQVFGGFGSDPWKQQRLHMFYGNGESFVFNKSGGEDSPPEVFQWTCDNYFFMWSNAIQIAMGGGGGQFGFVLDSDFAYGETNPCNTFGNSYLTSHRAPFKIDEVEVWGFDSCGPSSHGFGGTNRWHFDT